MFQNTNYSYTLYIAYLRASSYEPGNRAGSVTRTNSVVCSYGKFQPGRPEWMQETQPKWWNITYTIRDSQNFVDPLTLLIKLFRILLKWKYVQDQKLYHFGRYLVKESYFVENVSSRSPGWSVHMGEFSSRLPSSRSRSQKPRSR